ncbi:hypothetical protein MmiAt1_07420 [Methanimicrococcus sp. At1]|uniref:Uncharacterized protein n=1 Tax=Methanimicrococcus hacksteinii TaxID=3028293 RepID=A0ABU3VP42_9EURY|nr:hypothetical protein [Methanimicrococcus sp. At1]MDV0445185.1 hypothetical protein [Methanimicrococcus sp. At1]
MIENTKTAIKNPVEMQTKEDRLKNLLLLFISIILYGSLLIYYPQSDAVFLKYARITGFFLTGMFGFIGGFFLINALSGRKRVKQYNSKLQNSAFLVIIASWLVFALVTQCFSISNVTDPSVYRLKILLFAGSLFAAGLLIQIFALYTDDIAEKIAAGKNKKANHGDYENESSSTPVEKQTKTERTNSILLVIGSIIFLFLFFFALSDPDAEYLRFARSNGYTWSGLLAMVIGVVLVDMFSGRKAVPAKNVGFAVFLGIGIAVAAVILCFMVGALSYFDIVNPADYLPLILKFGCIMFAAGILVRFIGLYIDDFVWKYVSKELKF